MRRARSNCSRPSATWIESDVIPATDGRLKFHARVAANVLGMVEREIELGPDQAAAHQARLDALGVASDAELAAQIRARRVRRPGRRGPLAAHRVGHRQARRRQSPLPRTLTAFICVSDNVEFVRRVLTQIEHAWPDPDFCVSDNVDNRACRADAERRAAGSATGGGQGDGLAGGELAAGGVDVGAAVAAHGGVGAERLEQVAELVRPVAATSPTVG